MPSEIYYSNVRHDMLGLLPKRSFEKVLEIGGGNFGTILTLKQTANMEAWGLDIRQNEAPLDHMIVGSVSDDLISNQIPNEYFDLILANDVIEHVADTDAFVNLIEKSLESGGILALSVPNARQVRLIFHLLLKGRFPREEAGLFDKTHLRWFTKKDVMDIFPSSRYKLITHKSAGRLVPSLLENNLFGELLGLHNLFVFKKL